MKYYLGDSEYSDIDIPTLDGDPKSTFQITDNCYAYAMNLPGVGSINPGMVSGKKGIHGGSYSSSDFRKYCTKDGMTYCGATPPNPLFVEGQYYTAALFGSLSDMHWARVDSNGNWSDKMPGAQPTFSSFQSKRLQPHDVTSRLPRDPNSWVASLIFVAYFKVNIQQSTLAYMQRDNKRSGCTIL
jgi:hypothetical protein